MELNIRILITAITAAIAFWMLLDAKESSSQLNSYTRIKLWCSGFAFGFTIGWLITGGTFASFLWLKLLTGTLLGFQWAYRVIGTIRATTTHSNTDNRKGE